MPNPRALDRRRKSIRNIRKITRTMELIATARFKKAMDRAEAATAYTKRITQLVSDLANSGAEVAHPLLEARSETNQVKLLVLTDNRGFCGGFNTSVSRVGSTRWDEFEGQIPTRSLEISGKRGISFFENRGAEVDEKFFRFEDSPLFDEVEMIANRYLEAYSEGKLDRLDVAYMQFHSVARQKAVVETLLPLGSLGGESEAQDDDAKGSSEYEFLPSAESILEEVVPTSFKVKLFKCFLDAAVSEQVARMVAMKAATENADDIIRELSRIYNRARQGRITGELLEVMGGVEALKNN